MFGTILLAVDGSEHARRACELATKLAAAGGDKVVVAHYIETAILPGTGIDSETADEANGLLETYLKELRAASVEAEPKLGRSMSGKVPRALANDADECDAGLIVLGSRGLTDLGSFLLGGVTHKLLHLTSRPTLVAR